MEELHQTSGSTGFESNKQVVVPQIESYPETATDEELEKSTGRSRWLFGGVLLVLLALVGIGYLVTHIGTDKADIGFATTYTFVPAELSKSAYIPIAVPAHIPVHDIATQITFTPELLGNWVSTAEIETESGERVYYFQPESALSVGDHVAVALETEIGTLSGSFLVTDDPAVQAVFPATGTAVHEATPITIVFSRPMVPVTTLNQVEAVDVPIEIEPATPGRFKWVSTRNLQFIPDTTLRPAARYEVRVPPIRSLDGVLAEPFTHTFSTRRLEYESISSGSMNFNDSIKVQFNMPVDIDRMRSHVTVRTAVGDRVPIEITYGQATRTASPGVTETVTDQRVLEIRPVRDSHGRPRVWDFATAYEVEITQAHALFGVNPISQRRTERLEVPTIVREIRAESDRSTLVRQDMFDPEGVLVVELYDEVSLDDSRITANGLVAVSYGERCREVHTGLLWARRAPCERETDRRVLRLQFAPEQFAPGDVLALDLHSLVAPSGFVYNQQPIRKSVNVYPEFSIARLVPNHQRTAAAVDHLYVCSTTPLQQPGDAGMGSYITASERIVFGRWQGSRLITDSMNQPVCRVGEFQTRINYGLLPETTYEIVVRLVDQFGQRAEATARFTTERVTNRDTRFHHLQKQYTVTTPDTTTLTFAVENMTYMNMHVCETTPEQFLRFVADRPSNTTGIQRGLCTAQREERIELPNRYWELNYFQVNLAEYTNEPAGHYIITFSHPEHQTGFGANRGQHFERVYVSVTDLSLAKKELTYNPSIQRELLHPRADDFHAAAVARQPNLYWVVDTASLSPIFGATVTQFHKIDGQVRPGNSAVTNREGIAQPAAEANVVGAVVRVGNRTAVVANWADMLQNRQASRSTARTYVYTDRPIYRPGQTVHLRGIDRVGFDGEFETVTGEMVTVEIRNSRNEEIYSGELPISRYGTFAASIDLPNDAPLGRYQIIAFDQRFTFQVEEYEGSPFRLTATTEREEYINGDEVELHIDAEYYFGAPVQAGTVSYSVVSQQYFFDRYQDEFFSFGSQWYFCYTCWFGDQFLYRGEVKLDQNGQAVIRERLSLDELFPNGEETASRLLTYQVTATDADGRSVSTQHSFIVHYSDVYLGVRTDPFFSRVNEPVTVRMKTVDISGTPVRVQNIDYTVYKVTWDTFRRQEVDGGFYFHSEKQLTEIRRDTVQTNRSGDFSEQITVSEPGSYEVHASYTDGRGNTQQSIVQFYARGEGSVSVPRNNNYTLNMSVSQPEVSVGQTGSVLITTPHERARALITTERGQIFTYEVVDIVGGLHVHEFPVTAQYVPNIYVTAVLHAAEPAVQFNSVEFFVDRAQRRVVVDVTPNKTSYLPGDEVVLDIKTRSATGEPVSAEVSVAVADLSVLALVGNPKKDPLQFFYSGFPHTISTASNLKNILHEVDVPDGTKGGDGVNPEDLALQPRGDFRDTAFWDAAVVTDERGRASVAFTLPDNLTTWQIEAVAVTEDTRFGTDYTEFTSRKDVMVQPLTPRFFIAGDTVYIGAQVFNQTDRHETFTVSFVSESLPLAGRNEQSVRIRSGESQTVFFRTEIPPSWQPNHTLTLSARGGGFADTVIRTIPMQLDRIYESVATAGMTPGGVATEYLFIPDSIATDRGGVSVTTGSSMRGFFKPVVAYIAQAEQSRWFLNNLYQVATLAHIYNVGGVDDVNEITISVGSQEKTVARAVEAALKTVREAQRTDGGFAYSFQSRSSVPLTISIIPILLDLRDLGYEIEDSLIRSALQFVNNQMRQHEPNIQRRTDLAFHYAHGMQRLGDFQIDLFISNLLTTTPGNRQLADLPNSQLLRKAQLPVGQYMNAQQRTEIYRQLINRVVQSGRGAVLRDPRQSNAFRISNQIRHSAQLLQLLIEEEVQYPQLDEMTRWLLAVRDRDQRWYSDELTYHVVRVLHRYVLETEEGSVDNGEVVISKAGTEWFTHEFSLRQPVQQTSVALADMARNQLLPVQFMRTPAGSLYYDLLLRYTLPAATIPPRDEGITITRTLRHLGDTSLRSEIQRGDIVVGELTITIPDSGHDMTVSAPIPAGFSLVNLNLATEDQDIVNRDTVAVNSNTSSWWDLLRGHTRVQTALLAGLGADTREPITPRHRQLPVEREELSDSSAELYLTGLPAGVYRYQYFMRAQTPGTYLQLPAKASLVYFPEVFGRTTTDYITINQ